MPMHGRPSGPCGDGLVVLGRVQGEVAEQFAILTQDPGHRSSCDIKVDLDPFPVISPSLGQHNCHTTGGICINATGSTDFSVPGSSFWASSSRPVACRALHPQPRTPREALTHPTHLLNPRLGRWCSMALSTGPRLAAEPGPVDAQDWDPERLCRRRGEAVHRT